MKKWIMAMPAFLAAGIAATPVLTCPFCWPLYAGLLSALGLGFVDYTPYLLPATLVLLAVSLIPLGWRASHRRGYAPVAVGLIAALMIVGGKFFLNMIWLSHAGIIFLLAASIWNLWPKSKECSDCQNTKEEPETRRKQ